MLAASRTSFHETSQLNGSASDVECGLLDSSSGSEKSFIQQRVERLYGPCALAQGFFFKRSSTGSPRPASADVTAKSANNNNNVSLNNSDAEDSLRSLPVLRHLRPEFRAQLPVVGPRKPTDGSEQIIVKPLKRYVHALTHVEHLQSFLHSCAYCKFPTKLNFYTHLTLLTFCALQRRISLSPAKNDAKEVKASPQKEESKPLRECDMSASITSLTDQQPAAPKVVLPVLEPPSVVVEAAPVLEEVQRKDGHHFMNVRYTLFFKSLLLYFCD